MVKLNVSIDEQVREELFSPGAAARRSRWLTKRFRKELLSRKRQNATEAIYRLRNAAATLSEKRSLRSAAKIGRGQTDDCRADASVILKWVLERKMSRIRRKPGGFRMRWWLME